MKVKGQEGGRRYQSGGDVDDDHQRLVRVECQANECTCALEDDKQNCCHKLMHKINIYTGNIDHIHHNVLEA